MFEAVITLCVSLSGGTCVPQLLPGYEAETRAACEAALAAHPATIAPDPGLVIGMPAQCRETGEALSVEEVAPGVFVHMGAIEEPDSQNRGDVTNLGFIVGDTHVAVIDTGTARWMGEALWRAIRHETDLPISHVILTHMHPDHVLGASVFIGTGAQIVGHAALPRALADREANYLESLDRLIGTAHFLGTRTAPVDVTFEDTLTIDLGARMVHLRAWPTAHTGTDVTVLDVVTGTLFAGDLVFDRHTPALDGSLTGWRAVLDTLKALDVQRIVPGHGGPTLSWPEGAGDMTRYLEVLETDTRAAINEGQRLGQAVETIAASEAEAWTLFEAYNPRNATVAFTELEWD